MSRNTVAFLDRHQKKWLNAIKFIRIFYVLYWKNFEVLTLLSIYSSSFSYVLTDNYAYIYIFLFPS